MIRSHDSSSEPESPKTPKRFGLGSSGILGSPEEQWTMLKSVKNDLYRLGKKMVILYLGLLFDIKVDKVSHILTGEGVTRVFQKLPISDVQWKQVTIVLKDGGMFNAWVVWIISSGCVYRCRKITGTYVSDEEDSAPSSVFDIDKELFTVSQFYDFHKQVVTKTEEVVDCDRPLKVRRKMNQVSISGNLSPIPHHQHPITIRPKLF